MYILYYIYIYIILSDLSYSHAHKVEREAKLISYEITKVFGNLFQIGKPYENLSTGQAVKKLLQALLHCAVS